MNKIKFTKDDFREYYNAEDLDKVGSMETVLSYFYEDFLNSSIIADYKIIDIEIEGTDMSNVEYTVKYDMRSSNNDDDIRHYIVCEYDSVSRYKDDKLVMEKIKNGTYEVVNNTVLDSGECIVTFFERFEVELSENDQNLYYFNTNNRIEYINALKLILENFKYEIVDLEVTNSEYSITYRTDNERIIDWDASQNYIYLLYTCYIHESEDYNNQFLKAGYEILDETIDLGTNTCVFTIRKRI